MNVRLQASAYSRSRRQFLKEFGGAAATAVLAYSFSGELINAAQKEAAAKSLRVLSENPLNAEPPLLSLIQQWVTPNELLYIRNHGNIPRLNADTYRLQIEGLVERPKAFALSELQKNFTEHETTATLTCAGNRRNEMEPKVGGVQWGAGAIGNGLWKGVRLSDVLAAVGVRQGAKHVWFEGLDEIDHEGTTISFGGSIPLEKAIPKSDAEHGAILAWSLNGAPLSAEHGFPLRSLVPGYIGARSVKWLGKIVVSDRPSPNHYQADAYKLTTEDTEAARRAAPAIQQYGLNCAMAFVEAPRAGARNAIVRGYALAPGLPGVTIKRVEISSDDGNTWHPATLEDPSRSFAWQLWQADIPVQSGARMLLARAVDSTGTVQSATAPWNAKGYMYNPYFRLPLP